MTTKLLQGNHNNEFLLRFFSGLMYDCYSFQGDTFDVLRCKNSSLKQLKVWLKEKVFFFAKRFGFAQRHFAIEHATESLLYIFHNLPALERCYNFLQDEFSKQVFIELLKFQVLGSEHVKLPLNNQKYWNIYPSLDKKFIQERNTIESGEWPLNNYKLQRQNGDITLHTHPMGIRNTFFLEQYAYRQENVVIEALPGEVIIDGGGCWGDTALYFADKVGEAGSVYSFEFVPEHIEILRKNISLNPHLKDRITIIEHALYNTSGAMVSYWDWGPGTSLIHNDVQTDKRQASTTSLDDFVRTKGIQRIDYIKMDIEGSELQALQGAEHTLRTFRPKLAIALYHKKEDMIKIPTYLQELDLQYEFFLGHFTIQLEETILFATPKNQKDL